MRAAWPATGDQRNGAFHPANWPARESLAGSEVDSDYLEANLEAAGLGNYKRKACLSRAPPGSVSLYPDILISLGFYPRFVPEW